jgi:hypothetical protein
LALRNILVGGGGEFGYIAKISDFGLSRAIDGAYYSSNKEEIPIKWRYEIAI